MSIRNGILSPSPSRLSSCSIVLLEEEEEEQHKDEFLVAENENLRSRVCELERIVGLQQNEMILLQATTADLLRRISRIEGGAMNHNSTPRLPSNKSRLPPRSCSQSSFSLAAGSQSPTRQTLTRSLYVPNEEQIGQRNGTLSRSPRKGSQGYVNVPIGKSERGSPMRKWMSSVDMGGSPLRPQTPSGRITPSPSVYSNISNISRSASRRGSLCTSRTSLTKICQNTRDPVFDEQSGTLQLHINGRSVSVPVPSNLNSLDTSVDQPAPTQTISLDWVYGYRGKDVRHNLHYLPTDELVYFAGSIVVLFNSKERSQRHYVAHTSDVKCLAVHPNRHIVASGQSSRHSPEKGGVAEHRQPVGSPKQLEQQLNEEYTQAHVRVWDSITLSTLAVIASPAFEKAIGALSFSITDCGSHLVCVDESFQHTISVWNWANNSKLDEERGANDQVFGCLWHPSVANLLVLYGKGHLSFWRLDPKTGLLSKNVAIFEGRDKPKSVLSVCFTDLGHIVTGDTNGTISLWDPNTLKTVLQAHAVHPGGVFALSLNKKGHLISAGKDKIIAEWDAKDLVRTKRPTELPDDSGLPRCIVETGASRLVVGSSTNTLFEGSFENGFTPLIQGEPDDISTCVSYSNSTLFATGSKSGGLRVWDTSEHTVTWYKNLENVMPNHEERQHTSRLDLSLFFLNEIVSATVKIGTFFVFKESIECLCFSDSGAWCAIGFTSGKFCVFDTSTKEPIHEQAQSTQPVTCVQFSPDSGWLFVAAQDLSAVIYRLDSAGRCVKSIRIDSLSSWVVSADWDTTSSWIRANTAIGHLHHWTSTGEVGEHSAVRDLLWHTGTCRISFEMGCVAHSTNGLTCVTSNSDVVAIGRDNGTIRIYSNPVTSVVAGHVALSGHGFGVTSLCLPKNQLISVGNSDCSIFQWKIV